MMADLLNRCPFFVVGCPRSGTTLLQVMLNRHPSICIPPELKLFFSFHRHTLAQRRATIRRMNQDLGIELPLSLSDRVVRTETVYRKVREHYLNRVQRPEAILFGDKTPEHSFRMEYVREVFPNAKMIGIVRDPRDVAISLQRVPWLKCSSFSASSIWARSYESMKAVAEQKPDAFCWVTYESLVRDPGPTLSKILNFLGCTVDSAEDLLKPHESRDLQAFPRREDGWKRPARNPINAGRAEAWRSEHRSSRAVESVVGGLLEHAGYQRCFDSHRINQLYRWIRIAGGVARTAIHLPTTNWIGEVQYQRYRLGRRIRTIRFPDAGQPKRAMINETP